MNERTRPHDNDRIAELGRAKLAGEITYEEYLTGLANEGVHVDRPKRNPRLNRTTTRNPKKGPESDTREDEARDHVETYDTSDHVEITDGLWVWDYNLDRGQVDFANTDSEYFDGWFSIRLHEKSGHSLMNGERLTTVHPFTRESAEPKEVTSGDYDLYNE